MITNEEKTVLNRITEDCHNLHILTPPRVFVKLKVEDKDGAILHESEMLSRSWVRNAYNLLLQTMACLGSAVGGTTYGAGKMPLKDTGGTTRQSADYVAYLRDGGSGGYAKSFIGGANDDTQGVIVGSGTAAESFEDYALATKIAHGTGAGQLSYGLQSALTTIYDSGTKKHTVNNSRVFVNTSGGNVDVNEIGIYAAIQLYVAQFIMMVSRDVLPATVTVPNAGSLTVTYVTELTYPG